jgi:hypothetical protein
MGEAYSIVLSTLSCVFSIGACVLATYSVIITVGLRNSTHRIQYVPIEDAKSGDELAKEINDSYEDKHNLPM